MFEYNYTRETMADGTYNVNNINRVDGGEQQILLYTEIFESSIAQYSNIKCVGSSVIISFETELSAGEQTTLDTIVFDYKNNL